MKCNKGWNLLARALHVHHAFQNYDLGDVKEGLRSPINMPSFVILFQSVSKSEALRNEGFTLFGRTQHVHWASWHSGSCGIKWVFSIPISVPGLVTFA